MFRKKIIYIKFKITLRKILCTRRKKIVASQKFYTLQKVAFVFFAHLQICDFCIWKNICAADLRILCTTHFCTFADLHIYILHLCAE